MKFNASIDDKPTNLTYKDFEKMLLLDDLKGYIIESQTYN